MKSLVSTVFFAGLVVVLFTDPLFDGNVFSGRDLIAYNHPMEKQIHDAWARGRIPVWDPHISGGRPLAPNPNAGALYPVRALLAPLPFVAMTRWFPILHWVFAGWGVALLLGAWGCSQLARWLAAITFVFSGVGMSLIYFPNLHPGAALLPWVFWSVLRWDRKGIRSIWVTGFLLGLSLLAGDVFTTGMAVGTTILWIATDASRRLMRLGQLSLACALAGLLAAPLAIGAFLWSGETTRGVVGLSLADALGYTISPWRLLELALPFPFGDTWTTLPTDVWGWSVFQGKLMGMFCTLFAGCFALVACASLFRDRRREARFVVWLAGLALAFGVLPSFVPTTWLALRAPLPLRNPEKFSIVLELALAMAVGVAFDSDAVRRYRRPAIAVAGALTVAAVLAAWHPDSAARLAMRAVGTETTSGQAMFASANPLAAARAHLSEALAEGGLLWALTAVSLDLLGREPRAARLGAALLLGLVPICANRRVPLTYPRAEVFEPTPFARAVARREPEGRFRSLDETPFQRPSPIFERALRSDWGGVDRARSTLFFQTQELWNVGTVFNRDFDVGDFYRLESLRRAAAEIARSGDPSAFFASLSLRWRVRVQDQTPMIDSRPWSGCGVQRWDEDVDARPDIRWIDRARLVSSPAAAWLSLAHLSRDEIVLEADGPVSVVSSGAAVQVLERSAERLKISVETPQAGWLFVLRGWWPYRTIRMDDREVRAVPAQVAFSAIAVPQGRHRIEWTEELPGWRIARWGPLLFLLTAVGSKMAVRRPSRTGASSART